MYKYHKMSKYYLRHGIKEKNESDPNLDVIRKDPSKIQHIINQTEEQCLEAVSRNGLTLYYVKNKTPKICLAAVKQNPNALNFVNDQTKEICEEAVKRNGFCIQYVKKKTPELYMLAVKQQGASIRFIEEKTPELWKEALKQDGSLIQYTKNQTEEMALIAVQSDPKNLIFIREQTPEIIKEAISNSNSVQQLINFNRYKIVSIQDTTTGAIYYLNNQSKEISVESYDDQEIIESHNDQEIVKSQDDQEIVKSQDDQGIVKQINNEHINTDKDNNIIPSIVYYVDLRKNKMYYIKNSSGILFEIEKYIRHRYGNKSFAKSLHYFNEKTTIDDIKYDKEFNDGIFFIQSSEDTYDVYKKNSCDDNGWFWNSKSVPEITKIRTYGLIDHEI